MLAAVEEACRLIMSNGTSKVERCGDVLRLTEVRPPGWVGLIDLGIRSVAFLLVFYAGRWVGQHE